MERLIHSRISKFIQDHNLIQGHQIGLRPQFDIVAQLVRVVKTITLQFDRKKYTIEIFLDISKVFDRVWYNELLYKLSTIGFDHQYLQIIRSYLFQRSIFVSFNISQFIIHPITAGILKKVLSSHQSYLIYRHLISLRIHTPLLQLLHIAATAIFSISQNQRFAPRYAHFAKQHIDAIEVWTTKWCIRQKKTVVHFTKRRRLQPQPPLLILFGSPLNYNSSA